MIPILNGWRDQVTMLSLSTGVWDRHPIRLNVEDRLIPLHWLGRYQDLVIATCVSFQQINLLVIPLVATDRVAAAAMTIALDPTNHAPPPGILARAAIQRF
jgi:hypothetical protein